MTLALNKEESMKVIVFTLLALCLSACAGAPRKTASNGGEGAPERHPQRDLAGYFDTAANRH